MWVVAFFDLPVVTKPQKRAYRRFRDYLLSDGFIMLQYSVYARPCATAEIATRHAKDIELNLPAEGEVRVLSLTAIQFGRMQCFFGGLESKAEKQPAQLSFF